MKLMSSYQCRPAWIVRNKPFWILVISWATLSGARLNNSTLIRCSSRRICFWECSNSPSRGAADLGIDLLSGKLCFRSLVAETCVGEAGRALVDDTIGLSDTEEAERTSSSSSML